MEEKISPQRHQGTKKHKEIKGSALFFLLVPRLLPAFHSPGFRAGNIIIDLSRRDRRSGTIRKACHA
jgi:hypothetical protein